MRKSFLHILHMIGFITLIVSISFESSLGRIDSVWVEPVEPTSLDNITVRVEGWFPDGCWRVDSISVTKTNDTFAVNIYGSDAGAPGGYCPMIIIPYFLQETVGPLSAGDYVIDVTEFHDSERDPFPEQTTLEFSVRGIGLALRIVPSETSVTRGDLFTVDVVIEDISNLGAFQLDITFDSQVLHGMSANLGPFLGSTGRTVLPIGPTICTTTSPGVLAFGGMSFGFSPGPDGSGTLATISFQAVETGHSELQMEKVVVTDIDGNIQVPDTLLGGLVDVGLPPPTDLNISPDSVSLLLGEPLCFTARTYDAWGLELEITPVWSVAPPELGEIDTSGCFLPREIGGGWIAAVIDTLRDSSFVDIKPFEVTFHRGEHFEDALQTPLPYAFHIDPPIESFEYDLIPVTTYTYDPEHYLWADALTKGPHYPGSKMYITCVFGASVVLDSITIHIPPLGTSSLDKTVTYHPGGIPPGEGLWETLTDSSKLYIGYDWTIYDGSQYDDGLWMIDVLCSVTDGAAYSDTGFILLDTEDPVFHVSFKSLADSTDLPKIYHPVDGEISMTQSQQVLITIVVDQTTSVDGYGPFWPLISIVNPCFPDIDIDPIDDECDHINADSLICHFNAEGDSCLYEALATGRDAAGNILRYEEISEGPVLLLVDDSPPSAPTASRIHVYDTGRAIGRAGAVGQDWYGISLKVLIYGDSLLTERLTEVEAKSDGSLEVLLDVPLSSGEVLYVTARDRAGNESEASEVPVRVEGTTALAASKADTLLFDSDGNGKAGPGDTVSYHVRITNGGDMAATDVVFSDVLDSQTNLTVGSVTTSLGDVTIGNTLGDTMVSVDVGTVLPDDTVSISFTVTVIDSINPCTNKFANRGEITADDLPLILTDDPETVAKHDYTITPLEFPVTFPLRVNPGWNLISFPVIPDRLIIPEIFPQSFSSWRYSDGYHVADELAPCTGYFILFVEDDTLSLTGEPICKCCIDMAKGWNLIGSLICPMPIPQMYDVTTGLFPDCLSPLDVWAFEDGKYVPTDLLEPGKAVWVFAFESCTVCYSCDVEWEHSMRVPESHHSEGLKWLSTVSVTHSSHGEILEFGVDQSATPGFDAHLDRPSPPLLPETERRGAYFHCPNPYDAGLRKDMRNGQSVRWTLIVEAESEVTLSWDVSSVPSDWRLWLDRKNERVEMKVQTGMSVDRGYHEITIQAETVPLTFALEQNYPNPFNPNTTIRFAIPSRKEGKGSALYDPRTTLTIYNILGQKVQTLVDEALEPGCFTVTWDGKSSHGDDIVSGIYFYRLESGDFVETRRMLLLK
jgi:uncharacterized repeat protein (TIGR01451 family)